MNKYSAKAIRVQQSAAHIAAVLQTGSFSKASVLLDIQQSAVSQRIKTLEEALGFPLFERTTRKLRPTRAGEILGALADDALNRVEEALSEIATSRDSEILRVSVPSSFAMKWLISRLGTDRGAEQKVSLYTQDNIVDILAGEADIGIRYIGTPPSDLHAQKIQPCWLRAVASPSYIKKNRINVDEPDLEGLDLLTDRGDDRLASGRGWGEWAAASNISIEGCRSTTSFDRTDLTVQSAIAGAGLALGRTFLVEDDVRQGFLEYVGPEIEVDFQYWIVATYETARRESYQQFVRWVQQESNKM